MADDYSWDQFMMYDYKIQMCRRGLCRGCMRAHPGEPTRRRDHRQGQYSWELCFSFLRNGVCPDGDLCVFSHGNREMWYHPDHYRVYYCPYDRNCSLVQFCPYAHTLEESRRPARSSAVRRSLSVPVYSYYRPRFALQNSVLQGSSSSAAADRNQRPRLADQGTSSSVRPQSPQRHQLTDSSGAIPHLQADAASLEEARSKRKHDHEAGSSDN